MGDLAWYIPVLIFVARIGDVSLGTIRMIFVVAGWRWRAAGLGFFEVLIWALAVGGLIHFVTHPVALLSYAGGFATGNLVGMAIEQRLALGIRLVRVFNRDLSRNLSKELRSHNYRVTQVDGEGRDGPVEVVFAVVKRKSLPGFLSLIEKIAPNAIVTIERAEYASARAFADSSHHRRFMWLGIGGVRK